MRRAFEIYEKIVNVIEIFLIVLILLVVGAQIITRTFFGKPLNFPEEVATFALISVVFISLAVVERHDEHLKVDFLSEKLSIAAQRKMKIVARIATLCLAITVLLGEFQLFPRVKMLKTRASGIPYAWLHGIMIVFTILWGISIVVMILKEIRQKE